MDYASYFVENKALFGCYPNQGGVEGLEALGVRYFLDLTYHQEARITEYDTKYHYENYQILDRSCPKDRVSFGRLVVKYAKIITLLPEGEKVYVHCRGGHGRSGVVVAALLCFLHRITPQDAMERTSKYHSRRKIMQERWRALGSPQTRVQKNFILAFFKPLYIIKLTRPSLADVFDGLDLNRSRDFILNQVLARFEAGQFDVGELLGTGMCRIIFVSASSEHRELISEVLRQIRIHFFTYNFNP